MYIFKGFITINSLVDNTVDVISPIGELSPYSRSYSRELAYYTHDQHDNVRLVSFYAFDGQQRLPLSNALAKEVLAVADFISRKALLQETNENVNEFKQMLIAEQQGNINVKSVGRMVGNGRYWLPQYIEFSADFDTRENNYTLWFADEAFQTQYDKYEYEIIPPLTAVDDMFRTANEVTTALTEHMSERVVKLHQRVNTIANEKPYTAIVSKTFDWVNQNNEKDRVPSIWTIIVYGRAGNNNDRIRDALIDYILKNSDRNREDWERTLPDLFVPTEFYISPFWTRFATENLQLKGGIYSSQVPFRDVLPWMEETMYGYKQEHLIRKGVVVATIYKAMMLAVCGSPKNRLLPVEFELAWPEYCNIYTTSRDFNRISPETQDFIMFLNTMLLESETVTPESNVLEGYSLVQRGPLYYLQGSLNSVNYLVPIRYNFLEQISSSEYTPIRLPTINNTGDSSEGNDRVNDIINMTAHVTSGLRGRKPTVMNDAGITAPDEIITPRETPRDPIDHDEAHIAAENETTTSAVDVSPSSN